jgi:hypothetical protein
VPLLMQNVQESLARTVWDLATQGRPLTEAVTTQRFQLTTGLMMLLAYLDVAFVNDAEQLRNRLVQQNPMWRVYFYNQQQIPIEQSVDPRSPNYLRFYNATPLPAECRQEPAVFARPHTLFTYFFGVIDAPAPRGACPNRIRIQPILTEADFSDWRTVTIRQPRAGEAVTPFFNLPALRRDNEMVLRIPRVGFFSTPAFFANWPTNSSNEARVTMNQALIVALGKSFDDTNSTTPVSEPALAKDHAGPGTVCYGCHRTLDPMRQVFRQTYTLFYHEQTDPAQMALNGVFAFGGVSAEMKNGIRDLAQMLASHERFAQAWVQKLCYYANSAACVEDDPEFLRVAAAFKASKFDFKTLVRELLSSPLTTAAAKTKTFEERGVVVNLSRADHYCVALASRLNMPDICGLETIPQKLTAPQRATFVLADNLPADGYSRGAEAPLLANDPTLFFNATVENLCRLIADQVVDARQGMSRYTSGQADAAIADFVATVMALPAADPRAGAIRKVLQEHFTNAKASGASATDALKSTFILACESPTAVSMGL